TVTLKMGKGYEDAWLVIRDDNLDRVRQRIIAAFGMDPEEAKSLSLAALINNAAQEFRALGNIGREFPGARATATRRRRRNEQAGEDPWVAAGEPVAEEPQEQADPDAPLLAEIQAATTTLELKRFWAKHQPLSEKVETEWRKRGKELKAAGK